MLKFSQKEYDLLWDSVTKYLELKAFTGDITNKEITTGNSLIAKLHLFRKEGLLEE